MIHIIDSASLIQIFRYIWLACFAVEVNNMMNPIFVCVFVQILMTLNDSLFRVKSLK